ncbi:MAG: tripartite tricarboxylate transporter substrate binding protein [Betaproteobacteria bacterium]|nr:tripartite tricarboxylate transporter substrate binding protein [Betaproteobacteria bacterium]
MRRAARTVALCVVAACSLLALPASAQDYPTRPVRVILTYAPGGPTDFITRLVCDRLQQKLGQPFVVESRAGANLRIGTEIIAKAAPDGYTIGVVGLPHATNPALFALPYDTARDFTGIAHLVDAPLALSVPAASPAKSVADLIAMAKAKPGTLTLATAGAGTGPHLAAELLFLDAGATFQHIPYKGDAPAVAEAIGGRVDATMNTLQGVIPHIRGGKLRGLGVGTRERMPAVADVPTLVEQGYPEFVVSTWIGMIAPAGMPRDMVAKLNREINAAYALPEVREKIATAGMVPVGGTAEQFDALIRSDMARWARVIKARAIKGD